VVDREATEKRRARQHDAEEIALERLRDRDSLAGPSLDQFRRSADTTGSMEGLVRLPPEGDWTSSPPASWRTALDLNLEDPKRSREVRCRRSGVRTGMATHTDGSAISASLGGRSKRLPETVSMKISIRWDWHGGDGMDYVNSQTRLPAARHGPLRVARRPPSTRIVDRDVSVVVWGEIRTHSADQRHE
jgi:hypothetical protein